MNMTMMSNVPTHLKIRILYSDDDIVVIDKPCDLRSVPGHADPPPLEKIGPRLSSNGTAGQGENGDGDGSIALRSHRRTAQEAWVKAIQLISIDLDSKGFADVYVGDDAPLAAELLRNLGTNPASVPRKFDFFIKYCNRNSRRLLPSFPQLHNRGKDLSNMDNYEHPKRKKSKINRNAEASSLLDCIAQACYVKIHKEQRLLMNLPKPTEDWESAIGQLHMLGFGEYSHCVSPSPTFTTRNQNNAVHAGAKLHVVHRLDCQTSGIMVVARNQEAASFLSRAWRERESVQKVYLAHVRYWPPYHLDGLRKGTIDLALAPSRTERIKWEITPMEEGGKESTTYWKVFEDFDAIDAAKELSQNNSQSSCTKGIILELHPLTGRTHQLRIHCAAVGSGIVGDSLYGDSPIAWVGDRSLDKNPGVGHSIVEASTCNDSVKSLRLHAYRLSFPTLSGKSMAFESMKSWK